MGQHAIEELVHDELHAVERGREGLLRPGSCQTHSITASPTSGQKRRGTLTFGAGRDRLHLASSSTSSSSVALEWIGGGGNRSRRIHRAQVDRHRPQQLEDDQPVHQPVRSGQVRPSLIVLTSRRGLGQGPSSARTAPSWRGSGCAHQSSALDSVSAVRAASLSATGIFVVAELRR